MRVKPAYRWKYISYSLLKGAYFGVNPFDRTRRKVNFRSRVYRLLQTQQVANSRGWNEVSSHYTPFQGKLPNSARHPQGFSKVEWREKKEEAFLLSWRKTSTEARKRESLNGLYYTDPSDCIPYQFS